MTRPILTVELRGPAWQLWCLAVTGTDLDQHCLRALHGVRVPGLGVRQAIGQPVVQELPEPDQLIAWHACLVSPRNVLARNLHLLAVPEPGATAVVEGPLARFEITGGRLVPITAASIDPAHRHAHSWAYRTCRCWQAAWMIERGVLG